MVASDHQQLDEQEPVEEDVPLNENEQFQTSSKSRLRGILGSRKRIAVLVALLLTLLIALLIIGGFVFYLMQAAGRKQCMKRPLRPLEKEDIDKEQLPLKYQGTLLIKNVNVLSGNLDPDKALLKNTDILVVNGTIEKVEQDISAPNADKVLKMEGHIVTPGIVDMHSHLGVYAFPELWARQDGNEMSNPITPMMRAVDALFPSDPAIGQTLAGGVTTAQVLPGSGNAMGGEAVMIKLRGNSVRDLRIRNSPITLKMACGENPKRSYGMEFNRKMPYSRMGTAWLMRDALERARKLKLQQDEWDCNPDNLGEPQWKRPSELSLDPLVHLLRGEAVLNTHCYEVEDLEMMIRLSHEFDFHIAAFHHALSAWKIPDIIRENNITIATFADLFGYKEEAYDASVHAPHVLDSNGVSVAMKSDHPVIHSKDLVSQAARAFYYGLKEEKAIASLTSIPAKAIRMNHRVGSIEPGKEGDIVIWDRHPLELGAKPMQVFIEGKEVHKSSRTLRNTNTKLTPEVQPSLKFSGQCDKRGYSTFFGYAVKNAKVFTMDDSDSVLENQMIVVRDGNIVCMDTEATCSPQIAEGFPIFEVEDGETIVTPGPIEASTPLGLFEIEAESSTSDGYSGASLGKQSQVKASNGIRLQSRAMQAAWAGGVTSAIVAPNSDSMVRGLSTTYNTAGDFIANSIIKDDTALHISVGDDAKTKDSLQASISGQFATLERILSGNENFVVDGSAWMRVLKREIPLAVHAYDADVISNLVQLKRRYNFDMIIIGGAEAHLLADTLAENKVGVILTPNKEGYLSTEQYQTLRSDSLYGAQKLYDAGVLVGIGMGTLYNTRNLRWQTGLIADSGEVPQRDAIRMMTRNIADMFGLKSGLGRVQVNTPPNFVVYSGNPLTYEGRIMLATAGTRVTCTPEQF